MRESGMAHARMIDAAERLLKIAGMLAAADGVTENGTTSTFMEYGPDKESNNDAATDNEDWFKAHLPLLDRIGEMMEQGGWEPGNGTNNRADLDDDMRVYTMDDMIAHCFFSDDHELNLIIQYRKVPKKQPGVVRSMILRGFTRKVGDESGYDAIVRDLKNRIDFFLKDRENHPWSKRMARQLVRIARSLVAGGNDDEYQVWSIDSYGNEQDGWEFNDRSRAWTFLCESDNDSEVKKCFEQSLKDHGFDPVSLNYEWDDECEFTVEDADTGKPLWQINKGVWRR